MILIEETGKPKKLYSKSKSDDSNPQEFLGISNTEEEERKEALQVQNKPSLCAKMCYTLFPEFCRINTVTPRKVKINCSKPSNHSFFTNSIKNQKYNILTFIPFVILAQFSIFSNQFYLVLIISQFFEPFKVGFLIGYLSPLVFVIIVTLIKEGRDDFMRYRRDKEINNTKYTRIRSSCKFCKGVQRCDNCDFSQEQVKSCDIKVGDILKIKHNERLPADVVILQSESDQIFIRTDQLDGETDWKLRKPVKLVSSQFKTFELFFKAILSSQNKELVDIIISPPTKQIYEFQASLVLNEGQLIKESLGLENTMWTNTVLASAECICLVIYIGKETRAQMNSNKSRRKIGKLDLEINFLSKLLFLVMVIISIIILLLKERGLNNIYLNLLTLFRFIVLFCSIIPIALRVNLDISKTVFSMNISKDHENIPGAIARNSTIPEDLGRIDYLFCDKTGTLTKNEMVFKTLAIESDVFNSNDNFADMRKMLQEDFIKTDTPFHDLIYKHASTPSMQDSVFKEDGRRGSREHLNYEDYLERNKSKIKRPPSEDKVDDDAYSSTKKLRRNKRKILRDAITAMALCNSVNVVSDIKLQANVESEPKKSELIKDICNTQFSRFESCSAVENNCKPHEQLLDNDEIEMNDQTYLSNDDNSIINNDNMKMILDVPEYQASSPDEISLVRTAAHLGCQLFRRTDTLIQLKNVKGFDEKGEESFCIEDYEILQSFPFSSDTKRMGIILKNLKHNFIVFYLKGAESVLEKFIKEDSVGIMREHCESLASSGLRTLVISFKLIDQAFYNDWANTYNEALNTFENRKEKIAVCFSQIEQNLNFLCVTGVDDMLQDNVYETIDNLRNAGIKIWMLTGDKVETATCVSISTGIKSKLQKVKYIIEDDSPNRIRQVLEAYANPSFSLKNKNADDLLIIDGKCLEVVLTQFEEMFFKIALRASSVICCRCSPTQKAQVVKLAKRYTNKRLSCIGDGGNDVAMIQEADVGIGIVGKEGLQASLASDFSILTFSHLNHLLLWHGRISYKNTAKISKFIIHRGLIISFIQVNNFNHNKPIVHFLCHFLLLSNSDI